MKTIYRSLLIVAILILTTLGVTNLQAQPQSMNYQAVARSTTGAVLGNRHVNIRFSIHDGTMLGAIVYRETDTATTNAFGLFTTAIGAGTPSLSTFDSINWGSGDKFLQVEIDENGGATFVDMGTTQLLSVPYALHAGGGVGVMYCIAMGGIFPSQGTGCSFTGVNIYLGEIRAFPLSFVPCGWQKCDGTLLPITGNAALFSLLGTQYGGDGVNNFAVPDLRGKFLQGNQ